MRVMRILAMGVLLIVAWTALDRAYVRGEISLTSGSGAHQVSSEPKEQRTTTEFWDHQKEPIPTVITGEKATQIKHHMAVLFVPCSVRERKRAEKALVELVSTYKLPEKGSVAVDMTWSSPLNFAPSPHRRVAVALLHTGTGRDISLWVLCEFDNHVKCFPFEGMSRYCGYWQVVNDFDDDKTPEILIKHFVGEYEGGDFSAVWPAIYKWDGDNYIRADDEFPEYYAQEVVPKYKKIVEKHKDWENHLDKQVRRIYEKCKFVLEKAEAIARKAKPKS